MNMTDFLNLGTRRSEIDKREKKILQNASFMRLVVRVSISGIFCIRDRVKLGKDTRKDVFNLFLEKDRKR